VSNPPASRRSYRRNVLLRAVAVASCAVGLGAGCGGTVTTIGSEPTKPTGPVPEADFPNTAAHAVCDRFASCCSKANIAFDPAECVARNVAIFQSALSRPGTHAYDPVAGGACVDYLIQVGTKCTGDRTPNHSCDWDLLVGTTAPGGACQTSYDCVPPATCGPDGVCLSMERGKLGDPCIGTCAGADGSTLGDCYGLTGQSGVACYQDQNLQCGQDGRCEALPDPDIGLDIVGAPCSSTQICEGGLYCDTSANKCAEPKPPFSPCQSDGECTAHKCVGGECPLDDPSECTSQIEMNN
jgi:hypothetical protein